MRQGVCRAARGLLLNGFWFVGLVCPAQAGKWKSHFDGRISPRQAERRTQLPRGRAHMLEGLTGDAAVWRGSVWVRRSVRCRVAP